MVKSAICVGNNYPGTSAQLSGCVNDANDWSELLVANSYTSVLTLHEAAKADVLAMLNEAVDALKYGDRFVFTYSGHGSWVPDQEGDEPDGRDEVLCMADYMQGGLLTDDELAQIFSRVPYGAGILFLPDSCHSGSVSRFANGSKTLARYLPPTVFTDISDDDYVRLSDLPLSRSRRRASSISGCTDVEYSYDAWFGSRPNGAFTRAAIDTYQSGISLNSWHKAIRTVLPNMDFPQSPELTAASFYRKYAKAL